MGQETLIEKLMESKAQVGVIAEKAWRNFEKHQKNLHYFMLGHAFKQIDTQQVFKLQTTKDSYVKEANAYKKLQKTWLVKKKDLPTENLKEVCLGKYLDSIRNFNAHYIHDFSQMDVPFHIKDFLFEAFNLAILQVYAKDKNISVEEASKDKLVVPEFLLGMFFPWNNKNYKEQDIINNKNNDGSDAYQKAKQYAQWRAEFKKKTLDEALCAILFIQLEQSLYVGVQKNVKNNEQVISEEKKEHVFFEIAKDKTYLSLNGVLFFLSLFLYKDEAQKLISNIRGYKRNDNKQFQQKRNIFSFFAKKFSSEDIDSQEASLIKFRDIIQYLNKYPLAWNQIIDNKDKVSAELDTHLQNFQKKLCIDYAKQKSYQLPSSITDNPSGYKLSKIIEHIYVTGKDEESKKEKLNKDKERIKKGFLYMVYARNQDRFILFATRFLAERGYFGDDAQFKMYQFQAMYEQNADVDNKTKKEKDKLKYHDGRIVTFRTWKEQMQHFPSWDMPFVVQNNAIQVRITYGQEIRTVAIQRELLGFLLRHALEITPEITGKALLQQYFDCYDKDFEEVKKSPALLNLLDLEKHAVLTEEQKNCKKDYKKILPKRLFPKAQSQQEPITALAKLVQSAKAYEAWYDKRKKRAQEEEDIHFEKRKKRAQEEQDMHFEKRNQGKRFKWMFVFKAWNMLYFKTAYKNNKAKADTKHHKSFHITRDEFQELSRAMYNWTEQGDAAHLYINDLFKRKNFFQQTAFKELFDDLTNLETAFEKTLKACEKQQQISVRKEKYQLDDYKFIKNRQAHIYYINLSYFLNEKVCGESFPKSKQPTISSCLVDYYYPQIKMGKKHNHTEHRNFVEKLRLNYQEDTLLYQLALQYYNLDIIDKKDKHVRSILQEEVTIPVTDKDEKKELYKITAPFKQIPNLLAWREFSNNQLDDPKNKKTSYLTNIPTYLGAWKNHKNSPNDLRAILAKWEDKTLSDCKDKKTLSYDSIRKIDAHVLDILHKTMGYILHLERYCAVTGNMRIEEDNRIDWDKYKDMQKYGIVKRMRDKSAHFGIPYYDNKFFIDLLGEWEKKFVENEIEGYKQWNDVPKEKRKILTFFLEKLHNNFFERTEKDKKKQREQAQETYLTFTKRIIAKEPILV